MAFDLYPVPFALALLLAGHGLRKRSLSPSGAVAAFAMGYASLANASLVPGVLLLVFYFIGSRATKVKAQRKRELEDGHVHAGGNRDWKQVLCNSLLASTAAVAMRVIYGSQQTCVILKDVRSSQNLPSARALMFLILGHYSCCLADTLASELGILAKSPPRLVTTGRIVSPLRSLPHAYC